MAERDHAPSGGPRAPKPDRMTVGPPDIPSNFMADSATHCERPITSGGGGPARAGSTPKGQGAEWASVAGVLSVCPATRHKVRTRSPLRQAATSGMVPSGSSATSSNAGSIAHAVQPRHPALSARPYPVMPMRCHARRHLSNHLLSQQPRCQCSRAPIGARGNAGTRAERRSYPARSCIRANPSRAGAAISMALPGNQADRPVSKATPSPVWMLIIRFRIDASSSVNRGQAGQPRCWACCAIAAKIRISTLMLSGAFGTPADA